MTQAWSDRADSSGIPEFVRRQTAALAESEAIARVVGQHRREWDVSVAGEVHRAVLAGRHWDPGRDRPLESIQPAVGDWVVVTKPSAASPPVIEHLLERHTVLTRASQARGGRAQVLVANVDWVGIVAAFTRAETPDAVAKRSLHPRRLERYVTAVRQGGAEPLVILNKSDLAENGPATSAELSERLGDVEVVSVHCTTPGGVEPLRERMQPGQTIGFVGLSGVGKSSLVNRLMDREVQKVARERSQDARGRHTTTHRELFETRQGFFVIDTPGMREFAPASAGEDLSAFAELIELARSCKFRDCKHGTEPGCAVRQALASGQVSADRLSNYLALKTELGQQRKIRSSGRRGRRRPPEEPSED